MGNGKRYVINHFRTHSHTCKAAIKVTLAAGILVCIYIYIYMCVCVTILEPLNGL